MMDKNEFMLKWENEARDNAENEVSKSIDPAGFDQWRDSNSDIQENEADLRSFYDASAKTEEQASRDRYNNDPEEEIDFSGEKDVWQAPQGVKGLPTQELATMPEWLSSAKDWYKAENGQDFKGTDAELSKEAI